MTETDKAYLAAFIDGEGSISLNLTHTGVTTKTTSYVLRVRVTNTNLAVLEWIRDTVQYGNIISKKRYPSKSGMTKPAWEWYLTNSKASILLEQILPYMKVKKLQAETGIDYCRSIGLTSGSQKLSEDIVRFRQTCRDKMIMLNS